MRPTCWRLHPTACCRHPPNQCRLTHLGCCSRHLDQTTRPASCRRLLHQRLHRPRRHRHRRQRRHRRPAPLPQIWIRGRVPRPRLFLQLSLWCSSVELGQPTALANVPNGSSALSDTLVEIDDLAPVRAWIDPADASAFRALQVSADIVPIPIGQTIERYRGVVPAPGPGVPVRRPHAINEDGLEAVRLRFGWPALCPVVQSRIWFLAPRHDATKAFSRSTCKLSIPWGSEPARATGGRGCGKHISARR